MNEQYKEQKKRMLNLKMEIFKDSTILLVPIHLKTKWKSS